MMFLSRYTPPEGFSLGPLYVHSYSITMLIAIWTGYFIALAQARKQKIPQAVMTDAVLITLIAGVIGARLGYVIQNIPHFTTNWQEALQINGGGLSIHGAVVVGLIALAIFAKKHKFSLLRLTDCFALPLLAGQVIGRLGNYFNQELFGYPTNLPWKLFIDPEHRPVEYTSQAYFHPTFLYEMILNTIGFAILNRIKFKHEGQLTLTYVIVFAVSRFVTEIFRISDRLLIDLSLAQIISILLFIFSLFFLMQASSRRSKDQLK